MSTPTVLLADDDADLRHDLSQSLSLAGFDVIEHDSAYGVVEKINRGLYGVLISDIRMPGIDGLQLMSMALEIDPSMPVILITGHGDVAIAVEAMRAGAYDLIEKPFSADRLNNVVLRALEKRRLVLENRILRQELSGQVELDKRIVGRTPAMLKLRNELMMLTGADVDVLIWGETGSGKEVVARALHEEGSRKDKPFVALNCGAIPLDIMESELFGHEAGAFTSANKQRIGKLEHAKGGTIFLDEIESMPMELQIKLLRVIETRSIERLGSNKIIQLDVRFVAATKTDLELASQKKKFRADLYYRLNVVTIRIPPLRERKEDIPALLYHLAREARSRYRRDIPEITPDIIAELMAYEWPGNVRELRNVADRLVLGIWSGFDDQQDVSKAQDEGQGTLLSDRVSQYERSLIATEIQKNKGSIKKTYAALGLSRKALYQKMKKYQLDKKMLADGEDDFMEDE
ncbi:MAG: two-component system C4-dicarboxylate transport response regulator DctD [Kiritimatiellia bacterium]|jgi:two-component system C4-dicarboxylate transport response regulator DctD